MRIHVVSFQVPYPANYGGVIDVYYKLRALYEMGHDIVLHTFVYGDRQPQGVLEELCSEVFYYPRKTGWKKQWSLTPYTVASRCDGTLLEHLCEDDAPILFDGLHCCFFLTHPRLAERMKAVRMHNVEHIYYEQLMHQGGFSWKWLYYWVESRRLRRFERCLSHADIVYAITKADALQLNSMLPQTKVVHMPCFFDAGEGDCDGGNLRHKRAGTEDRVETDMPEESRPFILYHGNLAVEENVRAAKFIINKIAPRVADAWFVIAGRDPDFGAVPGNVSIVGNPSDEELDTLLREASIHLMLTFQSTGIKLKLLNALSKGSGHIIANRPMLYGHSLGRFCVQANTPDEITDAIERLLAAPPTAYDLSKRREQLQRMKRSSRERLKLLFTNNNY